MGWNERSDPDMRTANFKFSCDVYREGVYSVVVTTLLLRLRVSLVLLNRVGRWAPIYLGLSPSKLFTCFSLVRERGKMIVFYFVFFCQGSYFCYNL